MKCIRSFFTYTFWTCIFLFFTPLCLLISYLPGRYDNRFLFFLMGLWNRLLIRATGIKLEIQGKENIPSFPGNPSIFIMNHTSSLDVFLLEMLANSYPHVWLSKSLYGKIPLFSMLLRRMHILVKRENAYEAGKSLARMYKLLREKDRHALIFPEGTRHNDGKIHQFLSGFAVLAKKLNRPIIPFCVKNLHKVHSKGQRIFITDIAVTVIIGKPFFMQDNESAEMLTQRVQRWFEEQGLL